MKERPILFSSSMVRAILDGRKTQTRRIVKRMDSGCVKEPGGHRNWHLDDPNAVKACPYGQPGDRLWVRETFMEAEPSCCDGSCGHKEYAYRATEKSVCFVNDGDGAPAFNKDGTTKSPWKPSIFCTRAASRINLEITGIRVERLHAISEEDAIAEGVGSHNMGKYVPNSMLPMPPAWYAAPESEQWTEKWHPEGCPAMVENSTMRNFINVWENINGPESWDLNPFVWVVEFKRFEKGLPTGPNPQ